MKTELKVKFNNENYLLESQATTIEYLILELKRKLKNNKISFVRFLKDEEQFILDDISFVKNGLQIFPVEGFYFIYYYE